MHINRPVGVAFWIVSLISLAQSLAISKNGVWANECLASNNITQADLKIMIQNNSSGKAEDNVLGHHKCFYHCLAEKESILDSNGYIDVEKINKIDHLTDKNRRAIQFCKEHLDGKLEKCEYVFKMIVCLTERIEPNYIGSETEKSVDTTTKKLNE